MPPSVSKFGIIKEGTPQQQFFVEAPKSNNNLENGLNNSYNNYKE
jgi:hypothetical protein